MNREYPQRCSLQSNQADRLGIYVAAGTHADFAAGRSFESSTSGGNDEDCRHRRHWPDRLEDRRHTAPGRVNANLPRSRRYLDFRKPRRATAFGKRKLPCGGSRSQPRAAARSDFRRMRATPSSFRNALNCRHTWRSLRPKSCAAPLIGKPARSTPRNTSEMPPATHELCSPNRCPNLLGLKAFSSYFNQTIDLFGAG